MQWRRIKIIDSRDFEDLGRSLKCQKNYISMSLQANFIQVYIGERGVS